MGLTHNDGGYKSRKWVGLLICVAAVITCGKLVAAAALAEVVFGIVSLYGIFCGANVGRDWAAMKNGATLLPPPDKTKTPPKTDKKEEEGS